MSIEGKEIFSQISDLDKGDVLMHENIVSKRKFHKCIKEFSFESHLGSLHSLSSSSSPKLMTIFHQCALPALSDQLWKSPQNVKRLLKARKAESNGEVFAHFIYKC